MVGDGKQEKDDVLARLKAKNKSKKEEAQYFPTSFRLAIGEFKRFNDLAFRVKALRGKLTYESVFVAGLEALESKNEREFEQYVLLQKNKKL